MAAKLQLLLNLFQDVELGQDWIDALTDINADGPLQSVSDLINLPDDPSNPAEDLKSYMEATAKENSKLAGFDPVKNKGDRMQVTRFKTAFKKAKEEESASLVALEDEMDLTKPLKKGDVQKMRNEFTAIYNFEIQSRLNPAAGLITMFLRMRKTLQWTVVPVEKVKFVDTVKIGQGKKREAISQDATLEWNIEKDTDVKDLADYMWLLRGIANAMAISGTEKVPSKEKPGTDVIFAPWGKLLDYVDNAYEAALKCKARPLVWIRAKDQYTRGLWNELLMKGYPLGEAMEIVKTKTEHHWSDYRNHGDTSVGDWENANKYQIVPYTGAPPKAQPPAYAGNSFFEKFVRQRRRVRNAVLKANPAAQQYGYPPPPPPAKGGKGGKGKGKNKGGRGRGGGKGKGKGLPSGSLCQQDQGGAWFCVPYGMGGCQDPCPEGNLHLCSVRVAPKTACKMAHPACEHHRLGFSSMI